MESITLDREVLALKDDLMPRYARLVYNGYWFSPERRLLQTLIDESQQTVNGTVRLKLYKGTVHDRRPRVEDRLAVRPGDRRPSRTTAAPTTRPTPAASSS